MNQGEIVISGDRGDIVGSGMYGRRIFIRGEVDEKYLGKEVKTTRLNKKEDLEIIKKYIFEFCSFLVQIKFYI